MIRPIKLALISYHYRRGGHTRPSTLERAFQQLGVDYRIFHADFEHISKERQAWPHEPRLQAVPVPPYSRNISLRRIFSHLVYALRLLWKLDTITEDYVYICVPPTSALILVPALKSRGKRVIVDFVDLWPDALPLGGPLRTLLNFSLFPFWRAFRDGLARQADLVVACNGYFLNKSHLIAVKREALYLTNDDAELGNIHQQERPPLEKGINVAFLGSLNNVTDTEALAELVSSLAKQRATRLVLLGGGEGMIKLRRLLAPTQVTLVEMGLSFDPALKRQLLGQCHFGFNGYKSSSEVALSYKSIDYLAAGVPVINNAKGDLWQWVGQRGCGLNFVSEDIATCAKKILALSDNEHKQLGQKARALYETTFTEEIFRERLQTLLADLRVDRSV